jgi:hypothetical protein
MNTDGIERTEGEVPFFARFLESQDFPRVKTDVKAGKKPGGGGGGPPLVTMKWPSDDDEDGTPV